MICLFLMLQNWWKQYLMFKFDYLDNFSSTVYRVKKTKTINNTIYFKLIKPKYV